MKRIINVWKTPAGTTFILYENISKDGTRTKTLTANDQVVSPYDYACTILDELERQTTRANVFRDQLNELLTRDIL